MLAVNNNVAVNVPSSCSSRQRGRKHMLAWRNVPLLVFTPALVLTTNAEALQMDGLQLREHRILSLFSRLCFVRLSYGRTMTYTQIRNPLDLALVTQKTGSPICIVVLVSALRSIL